jgi:hypothetical protein
MKYSRFQNNIPFKPQDNFVFIGGQECAKDIFYLKKFLLACDINGFLIILGCET